MKDELPNIWKPGCCCDKSCTPDTCMVLPDGKTCGMCAYSTRCLVCGFTRPERRVCDWFPRRYRDAEVER